MSTAVSAGMQAALLIREKQRLRRKKFRKGRSELPSNVATREIAPFPRYPPGFWAGTKCSQGRAAWQERQGGRRCSLSEEAHQHRLKQVEAHHRWMKRNRIHDSSYGGESEEDIFAVYHQSAAANALLYVGLGTTAIGSVVFFVGSGDKGFKTLELRLIGPTLVACGLLCCLIRILLCACPSTCIRRRKKTRLKNVCPHSTSRFPLQQREKNTPDFVAVDPTTSLISKQKKRVSIAQQPKPVPSTSTAEEIPPRSAFNENNPYADCNPTIPIITVPEFANFNSDILRLSRDESSIELQNLELAYELESVSSNDSDSIVIETETKASSKLTRTRVPVHTNISDAAPEDIETCLSIVVERSDNSECSGDRSEKNYRHDSDKATNSEKISHSGILLSPLQLEQ